MPSHGCQMIAVEVVEVLRMQVRVKVEIEAEMSVSHKCDAAAIHSREREKEGRLWMNKDHHVRLVFQSYCD